ncbi:MAG: OmpA family protein [Polyangiaceae bacterium]|nr:OmpA family protein [Polyangiaceae bacterium]
MRLRPFRVYVCPLLAGLSYALPAAAQATNAGFALDRFDPSERGSEWFALDSQDYRGSSRWAAGMVFDWAHKPLVVIRSGGGEQVDNVVRNQLLVHPGASLVLWERLRAGLSVPVAAYVDGQTGRAQGVDYTANSGAAIGDVRLGADVLLLGAYRAPLSLGAGLELNLPTGNRDAFMSDGKARLFPHAALSGEIGMLAYAARAGLNLRSQRANFGAKPFGNELVLAAAAGTRLADGKLLVGPELWCSTTVSDAGRGFLERAGTPVEGLLGGHYRFVEDWRGGVGVGTGLTSAFGAPKLRVLASLEWAPEPNKKPVVRLDSDHDGIFDDQDACPNEPGEPSSDPARNGCPPPPPPPDSDGDAIADPDDACPSEKGVATDDPKTNGCPPDADGDGIVDAQDACPRESGEPNDDPQKNGCPRPPDRDADGILDAEDACPDDAGEYSADPAKNGCPRVQVTEEQIVILEQIQFAKNSDRILENESSSILQAVADVLEKHTDISRIRVEGHTDNTGGRAYNKRLSQKRAAAVVRWLTAHGIDPGRLEPAGFGQDRPKADNKTAEGRQQNRRVEFHIVAQGEKTKP